MELTQIEKDFASKRMDYYVNVVGLDPNTASRVVREELKQEVFVQLKQKQVNKTSTVANYIQSMYKLKEQTPKST